MERLSSGWDSGTGSDPLVVGFEFQPELVVGDSKIAIAAPRDRVWRDGLYFLRHDADVGFVAAIVTKAIEPKAIVKPADQRNIVLQSNI